MVLIISYLLGSIPSAFLLTRLITGKDVRQYGSGNVGATNATRVMGFSYGVLVGAMDILKGYLAVMVAQTLLAGNISIYFVLLAALLAIIGHNWSVFLNFTGGKGVATTFGVILRLLPSLFLVYAVIWLLLVLISKYVSLASIIGAISLPIVTFLLDLELAYVIFTLILALFIIIRHQANIKRLISGQEKKVKASKGKKSDL